MHQTRNLCSAYGHSDEIITKSLRLPIKGKIESTHTRVHSRAQRHAAQGTVVKSCCRCCCTMLGRTYPVYMIYKRKHGQIREFLVRRYVITDDGKSMFVQFMFSAPFGSHRFFFSLFFLCFVLVVVSNSFAHAVRW